MRWREVKKGEAKRDDEHKSTFLIAPVVVRIKAFIIDIFMIYMPILYIITYAVLDGKDDFQSSSYAPLIATMLFGIILSIFQAKSGQTLGSRAYEIVLIDEKTGKKPTFFKAFYRYLCFLVAGGVVVGVFLAPFRKDGKNLHDILSNTVLTPKK